MEDSVAVNIAVAKRLLWCAIKGNTSFCCIYKWACSHITFAHKRIAQGKKSERESSCSCIGLHLSNRFKVEGKVHFLTSLLPLTVLTVNYKVRCYVSFHTFVSIMFFLLIHFIFCFNNCSNVNYLVLRHQLTTSLTLFHWSHIAR